MKLRRCTVLLLALALTACGSKDESQTEEPQNKKLQRSDLTLPITAPMKARESLMHSANKAKDAAREREKQFDSVINRDR